MNADDDRIAHLMGEASGELDDEERTRLDDLTDLLADPSVWAVAPDGLEARVVAAIAAEAAAAPPVDSGLVLVPGRDGRRRTGATDAVSGRAPRQRRSPHSRRNQPSRRRWPAVLGAAAAAAAVFLALAVALRPAHDTTPRFTVALASVGAPGPSGTATLTRTDSGWEVEIDVNGLPRLDKGRYYQAWLRHPDGVLVPLGTFNEGGSITLWAGVSPADFPVLTVTAEAADGDQDSSGVRVLAGTARPSPRR